MDISATKISIVFKFNATFSSKHLSSVADSVHKIILKNKNRKQIQFNLSVLEWVGHEEMIYLSALFHYCFSQRLNFFIRLRAEVEPNKRQALQVINMWSNWGIRSFLPNDEYGKTENLEKYFDIDDQYILYLKKFILKIYQNQEKPNDVGFIKVIPFTRFEVDDTLNEKFLEQEIDEKMSLDKYTLNLLNEHSSSTPFVNKTLSKIITKELIENSIEHAYAFQKIKSCYFGIGLVGRIESDLEKPQVERIQKLNFAKESISESIPFYTRNNVFDNNSYLHYTFLDFGIGIPETLKENYLANIGKELIKKYLNEEHNNQSLDNRILEYAFSYSSSRHPIDDKFINRESISRGLYDVISIAKRYCGLVIVRSNYGKILYDFSEDNGIENSISYFDKDETTFFPGVIITLIFPKSENDITHIAIKAYKKNNKEKKNVNPAKTYYFGVQKICKEIEKQLENEESISAKKGKFYNILFERIHSFLVDKQSERSILYFDFAGTTAEQKFTKKILLFLASDYLINDNTNAVIINPPDKDLVRLIQQEIITSGSYRKFIFHPIPLIYMTLQNGLDTVIWLGVRNEKDSEKLTAVLNYDVNDLYKDSFSDPDDILGNLFEFDEHGNLKSRLKEYNSMAIEFFVAQNTEAKLSSLYLGASNYYQFEYITFLETLQDEDFANFIARQIITNLIYRNLLDNFDTIIAITLSSQLLAKAILSILKKEHPDHFEKINYIRLSNYNSFDQEHLFLQIRPDSKIMLVCDVISTGGLVDKLNRSLQDNSKLAIVSSIMDTRDPDNKKSDGRDGDIKNYFTEIQDIEIISLYSRSIKKLSRKEARELTAFDDTEIIRINPITNAKNTLGKRKSKTESILFNEPLSLIKEFPEIELSLKIGHFQFNNVLHNYFFDTDDLLKKYGIKILSTLINKLNSKPDLKPPFNSKEIDYVFYPISSGIEQIDHDDLRRKILNNHKAEVFALARFITPLGWRFSFPPKFLNDKTTACSVLLLDDGSCSGATIAQMIDEISFLGVKSITLLSIFARLEDFQREFYSRILTIQGKKSSINVNIYFASHWHIPTYALGMSNPYADEFDVLLYLLSSSTTPLFLIPYLKTRESELGVLYPNIENFNSALLDYLPKDRITGKIPILDIFLTRDKIGKIDGFRFYSDYFDYFDEFIKYFNDQPKDKVGSYQTVELILAVICYEPHLGETMRNIVPDVSMRLKELIDLLLENSKRLKNFLFEWPKKSIIQLLFILHKYEFKELVTNRKLTQIFNFCKNEDGPGYDDDALNVVFYRMMSHIPKSSKETIFKGEAQFMNNNIKELIKNGELDKQVLLLLKQFSSTLDINRFVYDGNDERTSLNMLRAFFQQETIQQNHDTCLSSRFGRMLAPIQDCLSLVYTRDSDMTSQIKALRKEWELAEEQIGTVIRATANLEDFSLLFFDGKLFNIAHKNAFSFSSSYRKLNQLLFIEIDSLEHNALVETESRIKFFLKYLVDSDSEFLDLFLNAKSIVADTWLKICKSTNYNICNKNIQDVIGLKVNLPERISSKFLFNEIISNFRHMANHTDEVIVDWETNEHTLTMKIINSIKQSNNGIKYEESIRIQKIRKYYDVQYSARTNKSEFIQKITFNLL